MRTRQHARWVDPWSATTCLLLSQHFCCCCKGGRGMPHRARGDRRASVRERLPSRHFFEGSWQRTAGVSIRQARKTKKTAMRGTSARACARVPGGLLAPGSVYIMSLSKDFLLSSSNYKNFLNFYLFYNMRKTIPFLVCFPLLNFTSRDRTRLRILIQLSQQLKKNAKIWKFWTIIILR